MSEKTKPIGYFIWIICASFFLYEFLLRTIVGTFQHPIMYDLQLNPFSFSIISSSAYLLIYGVAQIPVGIIVDKYGLRLCMTLACLTCGLATLGFSFTHTTATAIVFRMLMGLGSSFGFICLLVAVYDWLPSERSAFFIGMSQFIGTMGPMLAAGPIEALSEKSIVTWRSIFFDLSITGIVLAAIIFYFVKNNQNHQSQKPTILKLSEPVIYNLRRVFVQKQTWLIATYSALVYFFIEYFSENQGKHFLHLKGFSNQYASNLLSIAWIGYAIGCPLLGFLSDKINRRRTIMIAAAIVLIIALITIIYLDLPKQMIVISFLLLGIGASGQSIGFAIMAEQCRASYLAAGLGLNNAFICLIGAINAPLMGKLLNIMTQTNFSALAQEQLVLSLPLLMSVVALILAVFFIKETFSKHAREPIVLRY